jgi:NADPH2:quinone reductase
MKHASERARPLMSFRPDLTFLPFLLILPSIDTYFRGGLYPVSLPFILGQESAGTLVALHPSVTSSSLHTGLKVVAYVGHSYAEYVKVKAGKVAILPQGMGTKEAAGVLTQGLTGEYGTFGEERSGEVGPEC